MRLLTIAATTLALSLGAAALSASASAEENGNLSTCVKLATEVNKALTSNTQSPSYDAASKEKSFGRDYCASGLYPQGVTHYAEALKLLGADRSASTQAQASSS
ncbi:MAG TPA: hypothetical protein VKR31_10770 [Rhizomicrobium sp.]|nr:hypothetical protein [Rhizomicrobium sp.]